MIRFRLFKFIILIILASPLILLAYGLGKGEITAENRKLVNTLNLSGESFANWPKLVDKYWGDSIPYRSLFVRTYIDFWSQILYAKAGANIRGLNDFFYDSKVIENYLGLHPLTTRLLRNKKYVLASHQAYCALNGISYVAFFIPDKTTCYPENLPFYTKWERGNSWAENIVPYLEKSPINFIDLTPHLLAKKSEARIYDYYGDTLHWNGNGLDVAYHVMRKTLSTMNPDLIGPNCDSVPYVIKDGEPDFGGHFRQVIQTTNDLGYSVIKNPFPDWKLIQHWRTWAIPDLVVNNRKDKRGNLFQVSDSYFKACAQGNLEGAHGKIFPIVDDVQRYLHCHYADISSSSLNSVLSQFHPDFMVEEFVERTSDQWPTKDSYLLTIADLFLQTSSAIILAPDEAALPGLRVHQASWSKIENGRVFHSTGAESHISSDTPPDQNCRITVNNDGLIVLIARIESPVDTEAIWYVRSTKVGATRKWMKFGFQVKKGLNHVRIEGAWKPGDVLEWKFIPGQVAGDYIFHDIPEAKKLREESEMTSISHIQ